MMRSAVAGALSGAREATGLDVLFGGYAAPDSDRFTITHTVGALTPALTGLVIRAGKGLGGLALAQKAPTAARDYLHDSSISRHYDPAVQAESLRSVVAFPIVVDGDARGIVYGARRETGSFAPQEVRSVRAAADAVAFRVAVDEAVQKQVESAETAEYLRAVRSAPADREWEQVRVAFAELRELARTIEDADAQIGIQAILDKLTPDAAPEGPALSVREIDVLALVALGLSNREIGDRLHLELETVKSYLRSAMRKLGAHNRVESVALARGLGHLP
ncbi:LuxR C-terminal-related transcriptional regulator [Leucobacter aridicollis]|uniref:DNA-binding CsgD family transcriptional regulator n=1 Tax=Leucobacter aridicollis TaxID=283878 RepID=A0A852RAU5_9MICO|nr:LuxR C-terminal-related transcriptional regulator [Leucobacter aridicollis]MBL3683027.1 GAF domain-containing protein [Leucobacter aridicollis]NYD26466.1 DNA-binding CsgD family transcriptional regulator [Leucobacter aridicollis]